MREKYIVAAEVHLFFLVSAYKSLPRQKIISFVKNNLMREKYIVTAEGYVHTFLPCRV